MSTTVFYLDLKAPKTLEECFPALDELLSPGDKAFLLKESIDYVTAWAHHTLGRHIRNEWGLWAESELYWHLKSVHHLEHPDDMSTFILEHYIKSRYPTIWERLLADA